jgi:hypothetical protein
MSEAEVPADLLQAQTRGEVEHIKNIWSQSDHDDVTGAFPRASVGACQTAVGSD